MLRWAKRIVGVTARRLALMVSTPILWVEGLARPRASPAPAARAPLVNDRGYRGVNPTATCPFPSGTSSTPTRTWPACCVRATRATSPTDGRSSASGRSLCGLTRVVTARGDGGDRHQGDALHDRVELHRRARPQGRLREHHRARCSSGCGAERPTAEDDFVARDMLAYAEFLHQTPWYEYPFASAAGRLLAQHAAGAATHWPRKIERRVSVHRSSTRPRRSTAPSSATRPPPRWAPRIWRSTRSSSDSTASDQVREPQIRVVRELGGGRTLIRTPRYQAYTDLLVRLARRGPRRRGDRRQPADPDHRAGAAGIYGRRCPAPRELFEVPIQSRPDRRRLGLDVSVEQLGRDDPRAGGRRAPRSSTSMTTDRDC